MPSGEKTPIKMNAEKEDLIIKRLSEGVLMKDISKEVGIHISNIGIYRANNPDFHARCISARETAIESQVESLVDLADTMEDVNRARLKSDNIKWVATKQIPTRYGDRMTLDVNNTIDLKGALLDAKSRIPQITNSETRDVVDISQLNQLSHTDLESVAETSHKYIEAEEFFKKE